jgi:hypothetical protein
MIRYSENKRSTSDIERLGSVTRTYTKTPISTIFQKTNMRSRLGNILNKPTL